MQITTDDSNNLATKRANKAAYRWLMAKARGSRSWLGLSIGSGFTSGILLILQASLLAHIVDQAYIHHQPRASLLTALGLVLLIMITRAGLQWLREIINFKTASTIKQNLRHEIMLHFKQAGPIALKNHQTGHATTIAIEHVEALHNFFADYLPQMSLAVLLPLVILAFIFPVNWLSGLLLLITAPLIPLFMALIGMGAESINQRQLQQLARLGAYFLDLLQGLTTLKIFNRSQEQAPKIAKMSDDYRLKTMSVLKIAFLSSAVLELFSSIAIALVAVCLGLSLLGKLPFGMYGHHISLYKALFILLLAPEFFLPLRQLGTHYHARAQAIGAAKEISNLLADKVQLITKGGSALLTNPIELRFDKVCFAYEANQVINNLTLRIPLKQKIAIVGPSGVGKTTLLHLIASFCQPQSGTIYLNDKALIQYDVEVYRQSIAWLSQNPMLFHGTIRDNIAIAKPNATETEILNAAASAHVLSFVNDLPNGLDTLIGEQNYGLSGGQAQRIALARAYLKDAALILLDEPTASLDRRSEQLIIQSLNELANGRTMIMVSHRFETIKHADIIFELRCGQLIARSVTELETT